jgi:hypothetical protein
MRNDTLDIFLNDKKANTWRSCTFQSINSALATSIEQATPGKMNEVAVLWTDNLNKTVGRIMDILRRTASLAGVALPDSIEADLQSVTRLVSEFAIQCGIHQAKLCLRFPARGESVTIGSEYHHCIDGDMARNSKVDVDIVVLPGLCKVGDGASDTTTLKSFVPCKIYPQ